MRDELLTKKELAERLKVAPHTIDNRMAIGMYRKGVHYYRPKGSRALFSWLAIERWLRGEEERNKPAMEEIPMARGYKMGGS